MSAFFDFISGIFWMLFWVVLILGIVALINYNTLQRLAQEVKEKASNIQVAVSKKVQLVNQLGDVVRSFQQAEQLTVLKVSEDNTAQAVAGAYRESGQMLATIQSLASRFPDLQASQQYHRLIDSIQHCEANIEARRNHYNEAVKHYNGKRGSIPAVFVARALGFPTAQHIEFDITGAEDGTLRRFETPDGEQLVKLLGGASERVAGGVKRLSQGALEIGTRVADKATDAAARVAPPRATRYFYMVPGGVPKGPVALADIESSVADGGLPADLQVAMEGSEAWAPLSELRRSGTTQDA